MFAASRFRHPSALPILDAAALELGTGTAALYYVVPWADGESLRTRLEREGCCPSPRRSATAPSWRRPSPRRTRRVWCTATCAPENVLLGPEGARLADFGVARALGAARPATDAAGDIRCLGRVLYEMLAGEPPAGDHPVPLRSARRNVPEDAELLVARALDGERESAAALAPALRASAEAAGRAAPEAGTHHRRAPGRPPPAGAALGLLHRRSARHVRPDALAPLHRAPPAPRAVPPPPTSVALLPLVNAGPDSADDYLSEGIDRGADRRPRPGAGSSGRRAPPPPSP